MKLIKTAIIGATGYAGGELARLLYVHPWADTTILTSRSYSSESFSDIYCNFKHILHNNLTENDIEEISTKVDVIFLALPHGIAGKKITSKILKNCKIIDLGADFRLKDTNVYESWYDTKAPSKELLDEAVYGLCEIYREKIKTAQLVANPGCYTTTSILSLYPVVKEGLVESDSIIIDAKSGVTGAGRSVGLGTHYCETNENIKAYKIASHRHTPEIEQEISYAANSAVKLVFTPHLIPVNRGILATIYAKLKSGITDNDIKAVYKKYYGDEFFIRLLGEGVFPETKWIKGSNFLDIGYKTDKRCNTLIITAALDNLIKGAAGQAIQNMNIMFDLDEKTGLNHPALFPC